LTGFCEGAAHDEPAPLTVSYQTANTYHREWPHRPLPSKPFLRLHGRWLDEAGFAIGAQVSVQVMPGRLVLEVIEPERTGSRT
jgi:hypothetical protein